MTRLSLRLIAIGLFTAWFLTLRPTVLGGPANYIMVSGTSMEPTFYSGDLVIIQKKSSYRTGDVVAYSTSGGNVIHRIVEQRSDGHFILLGDNRDATDPMFPTEDEILGKQWVLVPNGGDAMQFLREPFSLAALGGFGLMTYSGRKKLNEFLQRRNRAKRRRSSINIGSLVPNEQPRAMTVFGTSLAVTLVFFLASIYALRQPATSANTEAAPSYSHTMTFDYDVALIRSALYQQDAISSGDDDSSADSGQPIYAQLVRDVDIDMQYRLQSREPGDVVGEVAVALEVAAVDGWKKVIELQPATSFTGTSVDTQVSFSVPEVQELISQIEEETGFMPGAYTLSIVPTISVRGDVNQIPVDSVYAPTYQFELTATRLNPQSERVQSQNEVIGSAPVESNNLSILGIEVGVQPLRIFGGTATVIGLLVTGVIAATVFLGLGRDEAAKVQARFKTVFIEASRIDLPQPASVIDVASLQDLARLAQRDGGIVFHQNVNEDGRRFFVPDGASMYQYVAQHGQTSG